MATARTGAAGVLRRHGIETSGLDPASGRDGELRTQYGAGYKAEAITSHNTHRQILRAYSPEENT